MAGRLQRAIEADIHSGLYDGAATIVAVGSEIAFNETTGYADRPNATPLRHDSVFPVFSISKALTAVALLQRVERGEARLDTPVCEVIPEFGVKGKARATLGQLLCHTAGVAPGFPAVPADRQGDLEAVVAAVCDTPAVSVLGEEASYSQIMAHAVAARVCPETGRETGFASAISRRATSSRRSAWWTRASACVRISRPAASSPVARIAALGCSIPMRWSRQRRTS